MRVLASQRSTLPQCNMQKCCDKCLSSEDYEPLYTYAPVAPALVEKTGPQAFVIERGVEEGLKGEGVVKQAKRQDGGCCVVM
jgi:hypothetical protein